MSLIDNTYFNNESGFLFIPNNEDLTVQPSGTPSVKSQLDRMIEKYTRELMLNALGVALFDELETALGDEGAADQKWKDLLDGRNYTLDGEVFRWDGLRGFDKDSLVAYFVYSRYLRNDQLTYTTTAIIGLDGDGGTPQDPRGKYVTSWTNFIDKYQGQEALNFCRNNFFGLYFGGGFQLRHDLALGLFKSINRVVQVPLFQYLNDSNELDPTAFPDFEFKVYNDVNRYGI